jgi:hypothetical protein
LLICGIGDGGKKGIIVTGGYQNCGREIGNGKREGR